MSNFLRVTGISETYGKADAAEEVLRDLLNDILKEDFHKDKKIHEETRERLVKLVDSMIEGLWVVQKTLNDRVMDAWKDGNDGEV